MRQSAANDLGNLIENVADVERTGHRLQQSSQAVDAFAPQLLALDDGIVLEREAEQIDDAVHQLLMGSAERPLATGREPQRAVYTGPLTNSAYDARARGLVHGVEMRRRVTNQVRGHLDVPRRAGDVQDE